MKYNTKRTIAIYAQSVGKYKISAIFSFVAMVGAIVVGLIEPLYFKKILDITASATDKVSVVWDLYHIMLIILLLEALTWVCWRCVDFCSAYFESRVIADLSVKAFSYLHGHSYSYFTDNFGGSLVKKVKWFTSAFENITDRFLWNFLPLVTSVTFITIVLIKTNIWLGLGILFWVLVFISINFVFTKYKLQYDLRRTKDETAVTGLLADTITNHNNVKLFNGYFGEVQKFIEASKNLHVSRLFAWNLGSYFFSVQAALWIIMEVGMYVFAIHLWSKGLMSVGGFVLLQAYVINIFNNVWNFGKNVQKVYESLADAEEMTIIFNTPHEVQDVVTAKPLMAHAGAVEYKNVGFNYNRTRAVLENFNLSIKPKEHVGIVGASGAGKTTVVKLLFRMHDVTSGHILIDGQDITHVTQESLWHAVSMVPQDPILFHRSLMENIRYGRPEATDEEVMMAAKLARCHDFITETQDGYNTFVGERGIKLSGGERQRVAIARAILKNAPVLVLDEATSSLDSESESLIQEALSELMKDKTVIVIAHRLSTIRKMDRIIVMDGGKIVEEGTHQDLTEKKGGMYTNLWNLQAGGFVQDRSEGESAFS